MTESWSTKEQIAAAMERFEHELAGWRRPAAHAVGVASADGTDFAVVNVGDHNLPAVVLSNVCGHRTGTRTYLLSADQLRHAVTLLAPAEACPDYDHPNLTAWRQICDAPPAAGQQIVAVFIDNLDDPLRDVHQERLRQLI